MEIFRTLFIPLVITMIPLTMVAGLFSVNRIRNSLPAIASVTALSVAVGLFTPFFASLHCAAILASFIPDGQPACVTGAVIFIPTGAALSFIAFLTGIYGFIRIYLKQRKPGN